MRYRKPEELKETEFQGIGQIPKEWDVVKLKWTCSIYSGESIKNDLLKEEGKYPVYGGNGILNYANQKNCLTKTIIIGRVGAHCGNVHVTEGNSWITDNALIVDVHRYFDLNYLSNLLDSIGLNNFSTSTAQPLLTASKIKDFKVSSPPLPEQRAIATFLDRKTQAIDALIQKKEQLIERLKEKRQALTTRAVTKGLDPDAPMKDSGIEWLGEIPDHWDLKPVKFAAKINNRSLSEDYGQEKEIKYIDISSVTSTGKILNIENFKFGDAPSRARRILRTGDTIISTVRTYLEAVAFFDKVNDNLICSTGFAVLTPRKDYVPKYIYYWVSSKFFINKVVAHSVGVSYPAINSSELGILKIPKISKEEQHEIVNYIESKNEVLKKISKKIESEIEKLKEYRQSLILAVVTGKIDVRDEEEVKEEKESFSANIYFRRRVLAAKILDELYGEPTFGRRKLQKVLYLLEKEIEGIHIKGRYQKDAAGPFDNQMMRSIESQLEKAEWFKREERENGYGYRYLPMVKKNEYKKYYNRYWADINDKIEEMIELFRPEKTDLLSLVATLYACWNDFLIKEEDFDGKKLIHESRYNWHEEKKAIPYKDWTAALNWMVDNDIEPHGSGELTQEKS